MMSVEIVCLNCHKPFRITRKRRINTAKFCSKKCETEYSYVTLECQFCGKEFKRTKGIVSARQASKVFCSVKCRFEYNKLHGSWNKGINIVETTCDFCGKYILRPLSRLKQFESHFCSKECYDKWKIKNFVGENNPSWKSKEVACDQCRKTFFLPPSKIELYDHHFCSRECKGEWMSENLYGEDNPNWNSKEVACNECGETFFRSPSQLSTNYFCSTKCQHIWLGRHLSGENSPNWHGGGVCYRGHNWRKQRQKALERDIYTCQRCKSSDVPSNKLDVHHIVPFREFGIERYKEANRLENLITLCRSCHTKVENSLVIEIRNS